MRFKATVSDTGITALEKSYLPTLEKFGKKCNMLLSQEDVYLIQDTTDADGMQISARLSAEVVFEPGAGGVHGPNVCQSRFNNFIGFEVELALLLKVLQSAAAHEASLLEMKLTVRAVPGAGGGGATHPMLLFSHRDNNVTLGQEMPIGKPHQEGVLKQLKDLCDVPTLCPFYLDLLPEAAHLMAVMDKLKSLLGASGQITLALSRQGDLHLVVEGAGVRLAEGLKGLAVLPHAVAEAAHPLTSSTTEGRLREARHRGEVDSASMQVKHLAKALHSAPLTAPVRMLCGVAEGGAYVHLMFVYQSRDSQAYDDNFSLSYKLPVREEGDEM